VLNGNVVLVPVADITVVSAAKAGDYIKDKKKLILREITR